VAGICLENGQWVRLRGKAVDGALEATEYRLNDGSDVRLLDVFDVELHYALPTNAHPEDWVIAPVGWRLAERPLGVARWESVAAGADKTTTILRGYRDRMTTDEVSEKGLLASLALVCPTEVWWWIKGEHGGRKYRAVFRRHHVTYDFAVTDPRWIERLNLMPAGIYSTSTFVDGKAEVWLTISLSEAFYGWHYKLVAGVIVRG
jgi:hypothetical protein